ncbi:hypothetical protein COOONC_07154 [Cooperia oncophora]
MQKGVTFQEHSFVGNGVSPSNSSLVRLRVLTEEDKIYDLTCAYSPKNVSVGAYYDTINFVALPLRNDSVLPTCHYSLRLNTLDGQRVQKAMIGQLVYHRWSCPSEEFAFKVYRCYIHNGLHQSYMIINENGCHVVSRLAGVLVVHEVAHRIVC